MTIMFSIKNIHITKYLMLLILGITFVSNLSSASSLTTSVDRNTIGIQETLTLTVTADEQSKDTPDFSALKNDFDILNSQRSSSIRIINGNTEATTDWQLTLAPKREGTLLIPSFTIENSVSDAIEITVTQQANTSSDSDEKVRVTIEVSKKTAYVQEQILVKIKLISQIQLAQAEMQPLELKNALLVNLDEQQKQYLSTINGVQHLIIETNYALFPQESGELTIPSVSYTVAASNSRDVWGDFFGRNRNNILRLRTDEQQITVKPVPSENTSKNWQPTDQLTLNESWSASLDQLKVGEPVTRTLIITADGLTGGQIAPIENAVVDGLTFYPDQAQTKDTKSAQGIQGSRVETIAIVPTHGGNFTLPEVKIDWWNNQTQRMQTTTLPAKELHVLGAAATPPPLAQTQNNSVADTNNVLTPIAVTPTPHSSNPWLWATTLFFMLLSIVLATYLWRLNTRMNQWQKTQQEADHARLESEKNIWAALKDAATRKDAFALRKAILNWASFQWPEKNINSLDEVSSFAKKQELTTALKELDELLYSSHPNNEWNADKILKLLNAYRKEKNTEKKSASLKPLYQH
jgi:BatD DUF11 like domain